MERLTQQERSSSPEKSHEEVYAETLKLKRDVLSSHYAMTSLAREINKRIEGMSDEEFKEDDLNLEDGNDGFDDEDEKTKTKTKSEPKSKPTARRRRRA